MELRDILEVLWRRRWVAINIFAAIFLTIMMGTYLVTPWYDSTAKVLIRKSSAASSLLSSLGMQSSQSSQTTTISETDRADYLALATVRPVVEKVISDLNIKRERVRSRLMKAIPFLKPILNALGVDVETTEEVMTAERLVDSSLLSFIFPVPYVEVEQYEETDVLEIEAVSPDPSQAAMIANAMARAFIEEEIKRVRDDYKGAGAFIDSNIEKAKSEYVNALQATKEFKEKEKTVNLDTETSTLIQKISDTKKSMEDNRLAIIKLRAGIGQIETQLKSIPKYEKAAEQIKENDSIQSLKLTLRDLYLDLAGTRTKYTKDHPFVIDIQNKIDQTKELVQKEMARVFSSETTSLNPLHETVMEKLTAYYADIAAYESQNQVFPKIIDKYESELMTLPRKTSAFSQLSLAVTVTQDIYDDLLKYQHQVGLAESTALSNIYLVEPAVAPSIIDAKHKHPSLSLNMMVAILLGATLGIGASLLIEYVDDTIRTPEDVKSFKGLTFLGSVMKQKKKEPSLISTIDPRSPLRETFRNVRNSIRYATLDKMPKSIVITSSIDKEGKSFLASNLAISIANEGKRVLVVDGDMRRPSAHKYFNLNNDIGLANFLAGDADLAAIQVPSGIEGVSVIPAGPPPPDLARLVESKKMQQFLKDITGSYDLVIVDSPSVLAVIDSIVFGGLTDGMVIVVESGKASRSHLPKILDLAKKANINLIGAVLNKVEGRETMFY